MFVYTFINRTTMTLSEIERQHDFSYPSLYRQLEQDGMLNVGEYGPDWYNTVLPALKARPTLLLFADDFELLSVDAVAEALATLAEPDDYRQIDPAFTFVPFAQTGAGDHYCFFPTGEAEGDVPIVLLWHDQDEARYVAKNLQDFIFSMLLDSMADQDTYNDVSDEEFREQLETMLATHAVYLTPRQQEVLHTLLVRDIGDYEVALPKGRSETHRGLLTDVELKTLKEEIIPFDRADFSYNSAT